MGSYGMSKWDTIRNHNGSINKKATLDNEHTDAHHGVVKSVMVGTHYYAVCWYENEDGRHYYLHTDKTWCDANEFWYKPVPDTWGPAWHTCPKSILDLADELCPCTEEYDPNGWARKWRDECRKNLEKKNLPTTYAKVKVGQEIDWHIPEDSGLEAFGAPLAGRTIRLTKWSGKRSWITYDFGGATRVPTKFVRPEDCEVVG